MQNFVWLSYLRPHQQSCEVPCPQSIGTGAKLEVPTQTPSLRHENTLKQYNNDVNGGGVMASVVHRQSINTSSLNGYEIICLTWAPDGIRWRLRESGVWYHPVYAAMPDAALYDAGVAACNALSLNHHFPLFGDHQSQHICPFHSDGT